MVDVPRTHLNKLGDGALGNDGKHDGVLDADEGILMGVDVDAAESY